MRKIVDVGDTTRKIEHGFVEKGLGAEEIELKREDVKMTSILECNLCGISKGLDEKKWKYADGDAYVTMRLCKRCLINFYEWMLWEMPVKLLSRRHSDMGMIFEEYAKAKDISFAEFQGCEQGVPMFKLRLADNTIKVKCMLDYLLNHTINSKLFY